MQRNILATSPRVTRFKIDWDDNPGEENVPPVQNSDSNQMMTGPDESVSGPLKSGIVNDNSQSMET